MSIYFLMQTLNWAETLKHEKNHTKLGYFIKIADFYSTVCLDSNTFFNFSYTCYKAVPESLDSQLKVCFYESEWPVYFADEKLCYRFVLHFLCFDLICDSMYLYK